MEIRKVKPSIAQSNTHVMNNLSLPMDMESGCTNLNLELESSRWRARDFLNQLEGIKNMKWMVPQTMPKNVLPEMIREYFDFTSIFDSLESGPPNDLHDIYCCP